jgi:hypothetical protein
VNRIELIINNGSHIRVTPRVLNILLDTNWVEKFKRSSGWVTIGIDPVRFLRRMENCDLYYSGAERRVIY